MSSKPLLSGFSRPHLWVGEVGCVCVVWCCCCKSMPSYFLIPSIAVLFCYWHQTPPATPLLCCLSPRPAAQTKQQPPAQPPQQARSRRHDSSQQASTPPSTARRVPSVFAGSWLHPRPGWIALLRCRSPGQLLSDNQRRFLSVNDGKLRRAAEYSFGRLAGRSGCMRKTRRERKEAPIRVFDRFSQSLVVARSSSSLGVGRSQRPGES